MDDINLALTETICVFFVFRVNFTPLHIAAKFGSPCSAHLLLKGGASVEGQLDSTNNISPNKRVRNPPIILEKSSAAEDIAKATHQTNYKPAVAVPPPSPLLLALEAEHFDVAECLLVTGADIRRVWEPVLDGLVSLALSGALSVPDLRYLRLCVTAVGVVNSRDQRTRTLFRTLSTRLLTRSARLIYDCGYQPNGADLSLIGGMLDKAGDVMGGEGGGEGGSDDDLRDEEEKEEDNVRRFKLWLFEATNYPRSLSGCARVRLRASMVNNALYGANQLNMIDVLNLNWR